MGPTVKTVAGGHVSNLLGQNSDWKASLLLQKEGSFSSSPMKDLLSILCDNVLFIIWFFSYCLYSVIIELPSM